ncbi:coxsackievirus and adenovirus receptor homolog [Channa argus]|uniref:coxsackievirus and adenovirus receptor homolog n=1 Tax=Channa argus TaxID=215402 RepID=UPI00351FAC64
MGVKLAPVTSVTVGCTLLFFYHPVSATDVQVNIGAEPGQTVSLPCKALSNVPIIAVQWSRSDLKPDYVLLYRDKQSDPENQHPSFLNRVKLKDKQMKDGDVSLIVENVVISDTGTYECFVIQRRTKRRKRSRLNTEPITTIKLIVGYGAGHTEEEDNIGHIASFISLSVLLVVLIGVGGFRIYKERLKKLFYQPPIEIAVLHV